MSADERVDNHRCLDIEEVTRARYHFHTSTWNEPGEQFAVGRGRFVVERTDKTQCESRDVGEHGTTVVSDQTVDGRTQCVAGDSRHGSALASQSPYRDRWSRKCAENGVGEVDWFLSGIEWGKPTGTPFDGIGTVEPERWARCEQCQRCDQACMRRSCILGNHSPERYSNDMGLVHAKLANELGHSIGQRREGDRSIKRQRSAISGHIPGHDSHGVGQTGHLWFPRESASAQPVKQYNDVATSLFSPAKPVAIDIEGCSHNR